jgi:hypothetical protein
VIGAVAGVLPGAAVGLFWWAVVQGVRRVRQSRPGWAAAEVRQLAVEVR